MAGINKVILVGNLGKDPEIHTFGDGTKKASFSLATTESYKDRDGKRIDQTEWHNIVLWRGLAEIAEKYLHKGDQVYIEGKIRRREYEDNGQKKFIYEILGENMMMLGGPRKEGTSPAGVSDAAILPPPPAPDDEGLPF
ncbi:MAG: single-stranded DNA-binding protein [Bacteroidales bacterium]|jgi:single-strand DNA-binding protein|nr:single-stranded DNA-binding protein [Bacteroidales bacterium]NPV35522.1 single-stranded DNA-binding protein [Bacteroidales bacterium]